MKKLVVVFVALTFLATFSLIGCNQSPRRRRSQPRRREHLERPERPEHLEHLEHLERPERPERQHQKRNRPGYRGYSLPKRIYPSIFQS